MEKRVFEDLKIAAFSWAMVGPLTLKFFADYGATVVTGGNEPRVPASPERRRLSRTMSPGSTEAGISITSART